MMLIAQTPVQTKSLLISEFKDRLRMNTDFTDDEAQDSVLERYLRSAITSIEARTGKILIAREFMWTPSAWDTPYQQAFPVSTVNSISTFRMRDRDGDITPVDVGCYALQKDDHRSLLTAVEGSLPTIPIGGRAEVFFEAGFSNTWEGLPPDITLAVLRLAAHFYEKHDVPRYGDSLLPYSVRGLIERHICP